jgi:hypothetical protein
MMRCRGTGGDCDGGVYHQDGAGMATSISRRVRARRARNGRSPKP